jgi:hypothetical protein
MEKLHEPEAGSVPPVRFTKNAPEVVPVLAVPVQLLTSPFGVGTDKPVGSVSPNVMLVSAVVLGFVTVKVSEVVPPSGMVAAPNAFASVGEAVTVRVALEVLPAPLSLEDTVTLLFFTPPVVAVTLTLKVQEAEAARVAPDRLTVPEPAAAVMVPPPHVPVRALGAETTRPAGNESVKATPVNERLVFGLLMVKLRVLFPFTATATGLNVFVICGAWATLKFAEAVLPVPPLVDVTLPVVLVKLPAVAPVTVTLNWHWLLAAMVAPLSDMPVGAVAVSVPPQTVAEALATVKPVGNVSVNATPVSATTFAAGFVMVKVSEVVAFSAIDAGLNTLAIDGGATTLTEAEAVPPVPPSVDDTLPVVLFLVPAVVPVTFTENVQELLAAIVPPDRLTAPEPAVAVTVPLPHVPVSPFGVETTRPAGSVSLNATPVIPAVVFVF